MTAGAEGLVVSTAAGGSQRYLAVDLEEGVHVAWTETRSVPEDDSPNRKIFYARSAGGGFTAPQLAVRGGLSPQVEGAAWPSLLATGPLLHLAWQDYRDCCTPYPGAPLQNVEILYKCKGLSDAWDLEGDVHLTDVPNPCEGGAVGDSRFLPALAGDAEGLWVAFVDYHPDQTRPSVSRKGFSPGTAGDAPTSWEVLDGPAAQTLPYPRAVHLPRLGVTVYSGAFQGRGAGGVFAALPGGAVEELSQVDAPVQSLDAAETIWGEGAGVRGHLVWTDLCGGLQRLYYCEFDTAGNPSPPSVLADEELDPESAVVAALPARVAVAFEGTHEGERKALLFLREGDGEWTGPMPLADGGSGFPAVCFGPRGPLHLSYAQGGELWHRCEESERFSLELSRGWNLVCPPLVPANAEAGAVFADLGSVANALFLYDGGYKVYPSGFTLLEAGRGVWVRVGAEATWWMWGWEPQRPAAVPVRPGWQLVGAVSTEPVPVREVGFVCDGETVALPEAAAAGWVQLPMYAYTQGSGYQAVGPEGVLSPGRALWLRSYVAGELLFY